MTFNKERKKMEFFTWMTWKTKIIFVFMFGMAIWCGYNAITLLAMANPLCFIYVWLVILYLKFFYERMLDWKSFNLRMVDSGVSSF